VIQAQRVRQHAYAQAMVLFERFDSLIAAAAPAVAPRVGQETLLINGRSIPTKAGLGVLTKPISCIGLPVCTVPVCPAKASHPLSVPCPWVCSSSVRPGARACASPPPARWSRQASPQFGCPDIAKSAHRKERAHWPIAADDAG